MKKIEESLGLSEEEIERRMDEIERNIPTIPGVEYIKGKLKVFDVQPWPFIDYLAHWHPNKLSEMLISYEAYDGTENSNLVVDGLKESYLLYRVLKKREELAKEKGYLID